jgi:hypothetical protein
MREHRGLGRRLSTCLAVLAAATAVFCVGVPAGGAAYGGYGISAAGTEESADIAVTLSDSADPIEVGGEVDYRVSIIDLGPGDAYRVEVQFKLPESFELVSVKGAERCESEAGAYCVRGPIPHGESAAVFLGVRATTPGTFTVAAAARSPWLDPKPDNNTAKESTQVNRPQPNPSSRLQVIDHVVNDNGGTAGAGEFPINVEGINAKPSAFPGNEDGTTVALDPGAYGV